MVEFRILGPVEAVDAGSILPLGGPRHRRLLAVLLLHAGRVVLAKKLIDTLWGDVPPRSAPAMLHVRVSELRAALRGGAARLQTRDGGYLLAADPDELDATRFERLVTAGTAALADDDPERARADLEAGLALWQGPALAEFADEPFARSDAARLGELRLQAVESRIAADLQLGRHREIVPELEKLVAEHPLRERFWMQQMLALYRAGRQAEALRAYQTARRHINEQLGLDPGDALQRLHHSILTADPALDVATRPKAASREPRRDAAAERVVPAQLPGDVSAFTGRAVQLHHLDELLADDHLADAPAATVAVVSGTAGVGKTALVIRWAHLNRGRFPDGQLYANLRGYDPDQPLSAADVLNQFLTALGLANGEIPLDVDARAARYRTELAGRRMLIVLDNASSVDQVRPLLPGTAGCAAVVTSRDSMAGLVARDGARRINLDLLPPGDAQALLCLLIGGRADAAPDVVAALADRCARLPLALRVAAELAASRPATPLSALVDELADQQQRLDLLDAGGDPRTAVTAVFSWSVRQLPACAARAFRLFGLHPGADLDVYAAAALTGTGLDTARRTLGALRQAHLARATAPGRYGMHDLLRAYATSLTADDPDARKAALQRLFDYYLVTATAAIDRLYPTDAHRRPRTTAAEPPTSVPDLTGPEAARAWLDTERPTLMAVAAHAARHGWPSHAVRLSTVLFRYLDTGYNGDALAIHGYAREAAERSGDVLGHAEALNSLGVVYLRTGRYGLATRHLHEALALFDRTGNPLGQARALGNIGIAEQLQGRYRPAATCQERALRLYREVGDRLGEARCFNDLGGLELRLGRARRAASHHTRALTLLRQLGDEPGQAIALNNLGEAEQRLGRHRAAVGHLWQSLRLSRQLGDRTGMAWSLTCLGDVQTRAGHATEATHHYREALATFREIGDRDGEPRALNGLGEAASAAGRAADALTHHAAALALAVEINARGEEARAHAGLGHAHRALANTDEARRHYQEALVRYDSIESPETVSVRAHLADLVSQSADFRAGW